MKFRNNLTPITTAVTFLILSTYWQSNALAAPYNLVQYPAGTGSRLPTPNVIVSVDDSGSMGSSGITALKTALKDTFDPSNLPDGSIRLAYQAMTYCRNIPASSSTDDSICRQGTTAWNTMRELTGKADPAELSARGQFFRFVNGLKANGSTYSHDMVKNAGEYLKTTGSNNPYNANPGQSDNSPVACRRSYHIFMTDGGWNSLRSFSSPSAYNAGNADGTAITFPDGTQYNPTAAESRIYQDSWSPQAPSSGWPAISTLSDLSFKYWTEDLQPGIPNNMVPKMSQTTDETFTTGVVSQKLTPYWNPKNNPATWQNMITYTIGYNNASSWPNIGTNPIFNTNEGMYGGDFSAAIVGSKYWRNPLTTNESGRQEELWHMAINGRGKFFPAKTSDDLKKAFNDIVQSIVLDNTNPVTSFAATGTNNQQTDIGIFTSSYAGKNWTGDVSARVLLSGSKTYDTANPWGNGVSTATKLDVLSNTDIANRIIYTAKDDGSSAPGIPFLWSTTTTFTPDQQTVLMDGGTTTKAQDLVNYIRGDKTKESANGGTFRNRDSRQGDIVNSSIWYVGPPASYYSYPGFANHADAKKSRSPIIYVGGNDGMLHGFSTTDGSEKISYIPKGVISHLRSLSDTGYNHRYFVDGSPFSGEVETAASIWKTMLIGTLGAGGKGYFILDITDPSTFSNTAVAAKNIVIKDETYSSAYVSGTPSDVVNDIGHILAAPVIENSNPFATNQITKMNDGRWAAIMGNGYNSANERAVLIIQYLDGAREVKTIITGSQTGLANGLSAPSLVDINGDGRPDVAYAGDLLGNMWKFDLSATSAGNWGVAFNGSPLYKAAYTVNGSSTPQSITSAPTIKASATLGGMMVAFGTGRSITEDDRTDTSKQTLYSILDRSTYSVVPPITSTDKATVKINNGSTALSIGRSKLVEQKISSPTVNGQGLNVGYQYWETSVNSIDYSVKDGWYMDFPASGERVLQKIGFYDKSNLLQVNSIIPASGGNTQEESCTPASTVAQNYKTLINIFNGKPPTVQLMDTNGDGLYATPGDQGNREKQKIGEGSGGSTVSATETNFHNGADGKGTSWARMPTQALHPTWRQLQ